MAGSARAFSDVAVAPPIPPPLPPMPLDPSGHWAPTVWPLIAGMTDQCRDGAIFRCWRFHDGHDVFDVGGWMTKRELQVFSWKWKLERLGKPDWAERYMAACHRAGWAGTSWWGDVRYWLYMRLVALPVAR